MIWLLLAILCLTPAVTIGQVERVIGTTWAWRLGMLGIIGNVVCFAMFIYNLY